MKLLLFFFRWCGGMRLYSHVMPVFSIDAPAVSGVVLELWPSAIAQEQHHSLQEHQ